MAGPWWSSTSWTAGTGSCGAAMTTAGVAQLWSQGVLARVPAVIDHAVVGAEEVEGGWVVVMRDVSAALLPDHARITRDDSRRVLEAAAALHAAFADDPPLALCSMADR